MDYYVEVDNPGSRRSSLGVVGAASSSSSEPHYPGHRPLPILELVDPTVPSSGGYSHSSPSSPWSGRRRGSASSEGSASVSSLGRRDSSGSFIGLERKDSSASVGDEPKKRISDKIYDIAILMKIKKTWKEKKAAREEAEKVPPAEFWW